MRANVFRPAFGNRPQTIVGRDALLGSVLSGLESVPGDRDRATLMLGQRGSPSYVQTYKRRLMAAGVISSPRRGELAFELPYLGEYLRGEL